MQRFSRCLISFQSYVFLLLLGDIVSYIALVIFFEKDLQSHLYLNLLFIIFFTLSFLFELWRRIQWIRQLKSLETNQSVNATLIESLHRAIATSIHGTLLVSCFLLIISLVTQQLPIWILFGIYEGLVLILETLYCFRDNLRHLALNRFYEFIILPSPYITDVTEESCAICLDMYSPHGKIVRIPCGHVFHYTCIDIWMMKSTTCPLCRRDLEDFPIYQRVHS